MALNTIRSSRVLGFIIILALVMTYSAACNHSQIVTSILQKPALAILDPSTPLNTPLKAAPKKPMLLGKQTSLQNIVSQLPATPTGEPREIPYRPLTLSECPVPNGVEILSILDPRFGAPATIDSGTDFYDVIKSAADYISNQDFSRVFAKTTKKLTLVFPKGVYNINRYYFDVKKSQNAKIKDEMNFWAASNIVFKKASNFEIVGCDAVINIKGDFRRFADEDTGEKSRDGTAELYKSFARQIIPFAFLEDSHFSISGFELNGNVSLMTKDTQVSLPDGSVLPIRIFESKSHGITTSGCNDYEMSNLYIHHFAADGIYLGEGLVDRIINQAGLIVRDSVEKDGSVSNVICANNARQGLSVGFSKNIKISDSWFLNTGDTEGRYGSHAPTAGIDVEPTAGSETKVSFYIAQYQPLLQRTLTIEKLGDNHTQNIQVDKCLFNNNQGAAFSIANGTIDGNIYADKVSLTKSELYESTKPSAVGIAMIVADNTRFMNNFAVSGDGVCPRKDGSLNTCANIYIGGKDSKIQNNTIVTSANGLVSKDKNGTVVIVGNQIKRINTPGQVRTGGDEAVPYISQGTAIFQYNTVNLPPLRPQKDRSYIIDSLGGMVVVSPAAQLQGIGVFRLNQFTVEAGGGDSLPPRFLLKDTIKDLTNLNSTVRQQFPDNSNLDISSIR